jgi:hypothetical protein
MNAYKNSGLEKISNFYGIIRINTADLTVAALENFEIN